MTHAVATKAMMDGGGGKIINVTLSPHHGLPGMAHSSAARAAVENLTRVLSIEWARFGIRLTALAAGHFATETLMTKYPTPVVEGVAGTVPLQRLGTEEEFAWLVAYLASPAGDYFSGAILTIDGGRDNWFGAWPPGGLADAGGRPLAEQRKAKE
jgi:citronellol/citronellal dehydrogenase